MAMKKISMHSKKDDADDDAVDSGVLVDGEVDQSNTCQWFYGFDEEAKKAWRVPAGHEQKQRPRLGPTFSTHLT